MSIPIGTELIDVADIPLENITSHFRAENSYDRDHKFNHREHFRLDRDNIEPLVGRGDLNDELGDLDNLRNVSKKDSNREEMDKFTNISKSVIPDVIGDSSQQNFNRNSIIPTP